MNLPDLDGVPPALRPKLIEAIERSLRSFRFFCRFWLAFDPHEKQLELARPVPKIVMACGSGVGKSTGAAALLLWEAFRGEHLEIGAFAPTNPQVKLLLEDIGRHVLRGGNRFALFLGHKPTQTDPFLEVRNSRVWFRNTAFGAEHSRGFEFHIVLMDEAAMDSEETFRLIASRARLRPGRIILLSTPKGKGNWFHVQAVNAAAEANLADEERRAPRQLFITASSYDNPHYDRQILALRREEYGAESAFWRQEYLGEFVDVAGATFAQDDIDRVFDPTWEPEATPRKLGLYSHGWDLAKKGAFTVGTTLAYDRLANVEGDVRGVALHRCRGEKWGKVFRLIEEREAYWGAGSSSSDTILDATGLGDVVHDEVDINAEGFIFTGKSRGELLFRYASAFGKPGKLRLPRSWTHLYAQHQLHTAKEDAPGQTWDDLDSVALAFWQAYEKTNFGTPFLVA